MKKVKVLRAESPNYWYTERIGDVFEVVGEYEGDFGWDWVVEDGGAAHISKCDCEIMPTEVGIESPATVEQPPLGLRPKHIADQQRTEEILDAMLRYVSRGKIVPVEWQNELWDILGSEV